MQCLNGSYVFATIIRNMRIAYNTASVLPASRAWECAAGEPEAPEYVFREGCYRAYTKR